MTGIGSFLKRMRIEKNYTVEMLAQGICSTDELLRMEANQELPTTYVLTRLCERLSISPRDFYMKELSIHDSLTNWLALLTYYFRQNKYSAIADVLIYVRETFQVETPEVMQQLLFYEAHCERELAHDLNKSVEIFQKSLNLTYYKGKQWLTEWEILLLSEVGFAYLEQHQPAKASYFFEKSVTTLLGQPSYHYRMECVRAFYFMSQYFMYVDDLERALHLVHQGITWNRKKKSAYLFAELLEMKAIILSEMKDIDAAADWLDKANTLKWLYRSTECYDY